MRIVSPSWLVAQGVALGAAGLAFGITSLVPPLEEAPSTLFLAAVFVAAWHGGVGPGLSATLLAVIAIHCFFESPGLSLDTGLAAATRTGVFALAAGLASVLGSSCRRAERDLRRSGALLREASNASPLAFYVVDDRTDEILFFSRRFVEMWGLERLEARLRRGEIRNRELVTKWLSRLANPEAILSRPRPSSAGPVRDAMRLEDGRLVHRFSAPIKDEQNRHVGRLLVFEDVTERQRARARLRRAHADLEKRVDERTAALARANALLEEEIRLRERAEQELRRQALVFANLYDGVALADLDGRILDWNAAAERIFGYTRAEVLGDPPPFLEPPAGAGGSASGIIEAAVREGRWTGETSFRRKDGTAGVCETSVVPLRDEDGRLLATVAVHRDVTEKREAERGRREGESILRSFYDSAEMMMGIVEVPDGDADIRHLSDNAAAARFFRTTPEAMRGRLATQLGVPHERMECWIRRYRESERTRRPVHFDYAHETPGGVRHLSAAVSFIGPSPAGTSRFSYVVEDVTERKQAEEERARLIREQAARAEAEAAKRRFALLAEAGGALMSEADLAAALQALASLLVPALADWCAIDVVERDGSLRRLGLAHAGPNTGDLARDPSRGQPLEPEGPMQAVLRAGRAELYPEVPDLVLEAVAAGAGERTLLRETGVASAMLVPLVARGKVLGAIVLLTTESGPRFGPDDLSFAEELAHRAAVAIDNARLYQEAQEAVRRKEESLALLDALMKTAPVGLAFVDPDLRYVRVNDSLAALDGIRAEDAAGRAVRDLVPRLAPELEPLYRRALETGQPIVNQEVSGETVAAPGHERHFLVNFYPVLLREGPALGVGLVVADITERKQIEQALRHSESLYRTLANTVPGVVFTALPDGRFDFVNRRWCDYTGLTVEQTLGLGWTAALHPEDAPPCLQRWRESVRTGGPFEMEFRLRGANGSHRWFLGRSWPVTDGRGGILQWVGTGTDIDERKRAEEALREADRSKDEFLAMLAHELRNPLAPIRNGLSILRLRAVSSPIAERTWSLIDRQVATLTRLVDDLLEVSRVTRGKILLHKEKVVLSEVVDRAVETARPLIESKQHQLEVSLPPEPILLDADTTRLEQVLANLLDNAARFTQPGGRIRLAGELRECEVVLRVQDSGIGMRPEMLSRAFELFAQADRSLDRSQGGLGIGLTLVKSLVDLHGGSVLAHSDGPGHGSEFVVRLPTAGLADAGASSAEPGVLPPPRQRFRILVVDDNRDSADSLALLLRIVGHEVHIVYDGQSAVDVARRHRPDVILLDIGLPGMDGYEVARRLREHDELSGAFIVAVSGYGREEDRLRSQHAGFDHYLTKPVQTEVLQALLEKRRPRATRTDRQAPLDA